MVDPGLPRLDRVLSLPYAESVARIVRIIQELDDRNACGLAYWIECPNQVHDRPLLEVFRELWLRAFIPDRIRVLATTVSVPAFARIFTGCLMEVPEILRESSASAWARFAEDGLNDVLNVNTILGQLRLVVAPPSILVTGHIDESIVHAVAFDTNPRMTVREEALRMLAIASHGVLHELIDPRKEVTRDLEEYLRMTESLLGSVAFGRTHFTALFYPCSTKLSSGHGQLSEEYDPVRVSGVVHCVVCEEAKVGLMTLCPPTQEEFAAAVRRHGQFLRFATFEYAVRRVQLGGFAYIIHTHTDSKTDHSRQRKAVTKGELRDSARELIIVLAVRDLSGGEWYTAKDEDAQRFLEDYLKVIARQRFWGVEADDGEKNDDSAETFKTCKGFVLYERHIRFDHQRPRVLRAIEVQCRTARRVAEEHSSFGVLGISDSHHHTYRDQQWERFRRQLDTPIPPLSLKNGNSAR